MGSGTSGGAGYGRGVTRIHHVNLIVPPGSAADVARFYVEVFDLAVIDRPGALRPGGMWLGVDEHTELHLSEKPSVVHPDQHVALVVDDVDLVRARLAALGAEWRDGDDVYGGQRGFTRDPVGNRLEVLERSGTLA